MLPDKAPSSLQDKDAIAALLPKAISILQNDLLMSRIECYLTNFQGDVFQLRDALTRVIDHIGGAGSEKLYALLYRVDIPESRLAEVIHQADGVPVNVKISEMLIIRSLQKAWTRDKFGS